MREIALRYLVGSGVAAADKYVWDMDLNPIAPNTIVFFNPRTGKTIGPGETYSTVPNLGIAQTVDLDGDGYSDSLRTAYGGYLPGDTLWNVTTEIPKTGFNKIEDFYFSCTYKETPYSVNVEWRNDNTLDTNLWNQWSYKTLSVYLPKYACDTCDEGIDAKEVSCALANQFYGKFIQDSSTDSIFLKRSIKTQNRNIGVDVMPILSKEIQYCISTYSDACNDCSKMDSIGGVTIKANGGTIVSDIVVPFSSAIVPGDNTRSFYGQKDRLIGLINKAFKDNGVTGHAVAIEGISGSGKYCQAGFNILINSCESVTLQDGANVDITPCIAEYNPYTGKSFTNQSECVGCTVGTEFVPNAGFRVIGKGINVSHSADHKYDRKFWYHTDVRITLNEDSNFDQFAFETMQEVVPPINLGAQFAIGMLDQNVTGSGFDYGKSYVDHRGLYQENRSSRLKLNSIGLNFNSAYSSLSFKYGLSWNTSNVNAPDTLAKGTTFLLIEDTDTATKASVKAIMDPWLASLPRAKAAINLTTDEDQIPIVIDATGTVTQEPGNVLGDA